MRGLLVASLKLMKFTCITVRSLSMLNKVRFTSHARHFCMMTIICGLSHHPPHQNLMLLLYTSKDFRGTSKLAQVFVWTSTGKTLLREVMSTMSSLSSKSKTKHNSYSSHLLGLLEVKKSNLTLEMTHLTIGRGDFHQS